MNKIVAYVLMIVGLALIVLKTINLGIPLLDQVNILFAIVIGVVLIVAGFFFMKKTSGKQEDEVPIYQGKGKKRRIVGYRRMKN